MKFVKSFLMILCIGLLFSGCKKECDHQYQSQVAREVSCAQAGEEIFTCTLCQHSYTQPILPVLEHTYVPAEIEKDATCAEEGLQKYNCTVCGASKNEPVEKLPHTLANTTVTKEPNCTEEGECTGDCTVCGETQITEKIAANGIHIFSNTVVREATCTDPGEGVNACTLCQYTESCQYELKEHTYSDQKTLAKATCTKNGEKQLICADCGHSTKETIAATGHKWSGASCTKAGVCSVCGTVGKKTDHTYVTIENVKNSENFAGYRIKKCRTCSDEKKEYYTQAHVFDLEAIGAKIAEYAKSRGLQVIIEDVDEPDYKVSIMVHQANNKLYGYGPDRLVEMANSTIDWAYNTYAGSPAGIGAYTAHIDVYYSQNGALGTGFFGVYVDITS